MSIRNIDLKYVYSIEAVSNTTINQNLLTPNMGNKTKYRIIDDAEHSISFDIFESGLVMYHEEYSNRSVLKTNMPFKPNENGDLVVDFQSDSI